jgi:hypothetical protein
MEFVPTNKWMPNNKGIHPNTKEFTPTRKNVAHGRDKQSRKY